MSKTISRRRAIELVSAFGAFSFAAPALAQTAPIPARPYVAPKIGNPIPRVSQPLRLAIIGAGNVGGALGAVWSKAGHRVTFADRDPAVAKARASENSGAASATTREAIAGADIVVVTIPFGAMPDFAQGFAPQLRGKIMFETTNPNTARDGAIVPAALAKGVGLYLRDLFPGVKIVRGFTTFSAAQMSSEAFRRGEKVAVPLAADDPAAMAAGARLVRDAGFDPVEVGDLTQTKRFELGGPAAGAKTAAELRRALGNSTAP